MDFEDENEGIFGELFGSPTPKAAQIISPNRPQQSATKIHDESSNQSDSDDDFALPTAKPSKSATGKGPAPSEAKETTGDGKSGASGTGAAAGAPAAKSKAEGGGTRDETADVTADVTAGEAKEGEPDKKIPQTEPEFDQTEFEVFPGPASQKETYWDIITPEQLVWHQSYPAIVVPERLHIFAHCAKPPDGVMAYGPAAKTVQPLKKRYVILHYFPLCISCHDKPQTKYMCLKGQRVEHVIPYNTVMAKKPGEGRALGAEDKWADTNYHYLKVKSSKRALTERNWKASMDNVHKFLARALERRAELTALAAEDNRLAEEELERQRQEMEVEEEAAAGGDEEGGEAGAGADAVDAPDAAAAAPQSQPVDYRKGIPLAPGDRILYWDRTKRTGAADARMEATIIQIRTKKFAKEENVGLLVLDNNQIVMDDWVVQKFVKDEETGEVTVAPEGCMVKDHKLKKGKLEGRDPLENKRMEALISGFREDIEAYGAGDQLRSSGGGGGADTESSDDDESPSSTEPQSKTTTKAKAKGSAAKKKKRAGGGKGRGGGGGGSAGSGGGGSGGGGSGGSSVSSGRKARPSTEEDEGDAMAASIARAKKKAKQQQGGGGGSRSGPPAKSARPQAKAREKGAKKQEEKAAAGKGKGKGGGGRGARKEEDIAPKTGKNKNEGKLERAARKGAARASNKKNGGGGGGGGGGERSGENAPVDLTGTPTGAGDSGGGGATGEPKAAKKRKMVFFSSLATPASATAEEQRGPQKKKAKKEEQQSNNSDSATTEEQQAAPKKIAKKIPKKIPEKQQQQQQQQRKSLVLPGGSGAGSAGGGGGDSGRKSATMAPAPIAPKGPTTSGFSKFKPPRPAAAAATGASDEPAPAAAECEWRVPVPKRGENS